MSGDGAGRGEPAVVVSGPRRPGSWPPTPRGWYIARMVAFGCVLVSQVVGLAANRTGELVRLRVAVVVLAGIFLVATTVDYIGRSRNSL